MYSLLFAFLIVIFNFYFLIFNLDIVQAAEYIFGSDSTTGDFIIREKGGNVKLRIDAASGNLIAPFKNSTDGENLVPNGGFENDVDGDNVPDSWMKNFQTGCTNCSYSYDATNTIVRDGTRSLTLTTSAAPFNSDIVTEVSDTFPITPGKTYTASIDVKGGGGGFSLKILLFSSSGTSGFTDADSNDTITITNSVTTADSWTNYAGDFTAPSTCGATNNLGCTRARLLIIHNPGTSSTVRYFDNAKVSLQRVNTPLTAANVSSGAFGSNTGGGIYSFLSNVGIGTAVPAAKLDIAGITSTISNSSGDINILPAANLIIPQGFVGIGTTSPIHKIDVSGAVKLGDEGVKPACSSTHRGTLWMDYGDTGIKDSLELCAKDANEAYFWRTLY